MNSNDAKLIAECLTGRSEAFGELVCRYQNRLYNSVYRMLNDHEDALDVTQDAFLNAYHSLNSFKGDSEFFTWLYRIAFNAAVSLKRKKKLSYSLNWGSDEFSNFEPVDESYGVAPDASIEKNEEEMKVQSLINQLSNDHRAVLVLKDIEGYKYEVIADILDIPIGTVRSRLNRARLELRSIFEKQEENQK